MMGLTTPAPANRTQANAVACALEAALGLLCPKSVARYTAFGGFTGNEAYLVVGDRAAFENLWKFGSEFVSLARSFLEKEVRVVVLHIRDDGRLYLGRKQTLGDPFGYLSANPDLIFHGVIRSIGEDVAHVLMDIDWKRLEYDELGRVVGPLRRADCPYAVWSDLRVGMRVRLGLGACRFENRELQALPKP
jgi:hypothetical protein